MAIAIKKFRWISIILVVFLLSACTEEEVQHFSSKEEALDSFIEKNDVKGNIDQILTKRGDELLVVQTKEDTFFVGERIQNQKGHYAQRISDNFSLGLGGAWELTTKANNKYTIYLDQSKKDMNYTSFSNGEYEMALVEGHKITKNIPEFINAIKEVEVIKD